MRPIPDSIKKIYNQFETVSLEHAMVYEVIVRNTLTATAIELEHTHPDVSQQLREWIETIRTGT